MNQFLSLKVNQFVNSAQQLFNLAYRNMSNFFDWDNQNDYFNQKDDKCLENTDHTTGNAFARMHDDIFNNDYHLLINQNEERMIHCVDQNNYMDDSQFEAQDLDFLEDEEQKQPKLDSLDSIKQEFPNLEPIKDSIKLESLNFAQSNISPENFKQTQNEPEEEPDYKLSKKWKEKINTVLEQKNIHQFSAKHNRNMAKFFVRLFSKYIKLNSDKQIFSSETQQKVKEILEKNCISLKDLQCLFGGECSRISRQFLARVLRTRLKQEVIKSQDVQNKAAYLLCSKVYALRCRSRHLTGRLQSR